MRLAPLNRFKPSSKIFYWPFQSGTSFVDLLCFCSVLCLLCFVRVCLYVLRGHLLGKGWPLGSRLWCLLWVCHFPIGILGQVWYLIVSIPDLCNLTYFKVLQFIFTATVLYVKSVYSLRQEFYVHLMYIYWDGKFYAHSVSIYCERSFMWPQHIFTKTARLCTFCVYLLKWLFYVHSEYIYCDSSFRCPSWVCLLTRLFYVQSVYSEPL